jgi:hypothetical protein
VVRVRANRETLELQFTAHEREMSTVSNFLQN